MAEMLSVEYDELIARAAELEAPLPAAPAEAPVPPCEVPFVVDSATQLGLSSGAIRDCIRYCEQEYQALAQSLKNAAQAYEEVDAAAAESMGGESSGSGATAESSGGDSQALSGGDGQAMGRTDARTPEGWTPYVILPDSVELPYYDVDTAARDIEAPDQGPAFSGFAGDWDSYALTLQQDVMPRLRAFEYWDGTAAKAVEANFEAHKKYTIGLVGYCNQIAAQARQVVAAHKWAVTEHPSTYECGLAKMNYLNFMHYNDPKFLRAFKEDYAKIQQKSEEVLAQYRLQGGMPLAPVYPSAPPTATHIPPADAALPSEDSGGLGDVLSGALEDVLSGGLDGVLPGSGGEALPAGGGEALPAGGGEVLSGVGGYPYSGNLYDAVSGLADTVANPYAGTAAGAGDAAAASGLSVGSGMKPASVGGGVGGVDVPGTPLQPPTAAESAAQAGAGRGAGIGGVAGAGGGAGAGGAAGSRGGMGMAPMGGAPGAGQGQGQDKKAKRLGEEEEIYTEDRAWTSGIIGIRARNDTPDDTRR